MTCQIIENLAEVADRYDALFCDVWGCYHNGLTPFPAAVAALQSFRAGGGVVILLTNAPRPAPSVQAVLDRMGGPRDSYDAIVSSGAACQAAVASGRYGRRINYVGPDRDLHMLQDVGLSSTPIEQAEAVLLTGLRDDSVETPEDYAAEIAVWVDRKLPVLCANPDLVVDRGEQRLWCAGALAKACEDSGGNVVWFGKPHLPVYDRCHEIIAEMDRQIAPSRVLAIGDGIITDVPGGIAAGLDTLFVTGGLAAGEFGPDVDHPDPTLLQAFLNAEGLAPRYAIGRLR
ncbi:MAG: TIGR01459 family HAD-type hydrolase [Pseudomonadota bacterium]